MNAAQLELAVRALASEFPDKAFPVAEESYDSCKYFEEIVDEGGDPSTNYITDIPCCIFGHAFVKLGEGREIVTDHFVNKARVHRLASRVVDDVVSAQMREWYQEVQTAQDMGRTWSSAVQQADARYPPWR